MCKSTWTHFSGFKGWVNPFAKVTGCLSVCLSVPKDLANRWTEMVLLYNVFFIILGRFITILEEGSPKRNQPKERNTKKKLSSR